MSGEVLSGDHAVRRTTRDREEALLVSPHADDHRLLGRMFAEQSWTLFQSMTVTGALKLLRDSRVPLVISERDLFTSDWKDLLLGMQELPHAPLLIVMSHQADESLWSEVLNLCGHDVLAKPLYPPEALRVIRHAFCRWHLTEGQGRKGKTARE